MTLLRITSLTIRALVAVALVGSILIPAGHGIPAAASKGSVRAAAGASLVSHLPLARTELVDVGDADLSAAIHRIMARPEVLYAEPNFIYYGAATPDDAHFPELWGMDNQGQEVGLAGRPDADIDATQAWDRTTGDHSALVADHPDLEANIWTNPGEAGPKGDNGQDDDGNTSAPPVPRITSSPGVPVLADSPSQRRPAPAPTGGTADSNARQAAVNTAEVLNIRRN